MDHLRSLAHTNGSQAHHMQMRVMPVLFVLISVRLVVFAQENQCSAVVLPNENRCVFSKSVDITFGVLRSKNRNAEFFASFTSPSFAGLERITTPGGLQFRNKGQIITTYPDSLTILLESNASRSLSLCGVAPQLTRGCKDPDMPLTGIRVTWVDSSGHPVDWKSCVLRSMVEPWSENRPPRRWYVADLTGIKAPITATVKMTLIGLRNETLGTLRGSLAERLDTPMK